jgi:DNA (cytosine-5)-methyltransferase 1
MRYGSVCSGIEAATVAWESLGWQPVFFAEIDPFCCALLKEKYPEVPNLGDFTKIQASDIREPIDVMVGGTPCQSFSVAGKRGGLDDPRGNLTLEFLRLAGRLRPTWIVWENVPGVLSIDKGRTFGAFLHALGELGYGFAYRILDAQFFGVAQRRRRVFVVGCLGSWQRAAAVLFDAPGLRWNPPPSREKGKRVAPTLEGRAGRSGANSFATSGGLEVCPTLRASKNETGGDRPPGTDVDTADSLIVDRQTDSSFHSGRMNKISPTLGANSYSPYKSKGGDQELEFCVLQECHERERERVDVAPTLKGEGFDASEDGTGSMQVRRLTPKECEKLQGFPPGWTAITYRGKLAADGPRFRAIGNSFAVPVMRWLGQRIQMVSDLDK